MQRCKATSSQSLMLKQHEVDLVLREQKRLVGHFIRDCWKRLGVQHAAHDKLRGEHLLNLRKL